MTGIEGIFQQGDAQRFTALRSKGIWKTSALLASCCSIKLICSTHILQPLFFKAAVA